MNEIEDLRKQVASLTDSRSHAWKTCAASDKAYQAERELRKALEMQVDALKSRLATLDAIAIEDSAERCAELREQEPVAGMHTSGQLAPWHKHWEGRPEYAGWQPLYSAPPEPAPQATKEDAMDYTSIAQEVSSGDGSELTGDEVLRFGQAVSEESLRKFRVIVYEELIKVADGWDDKSEAHGMRMAARIVSGRSNAGVTGARKREC